MRRNETDLRNRIEWDLVISCVNDIENDIEQHVDEKYLKYKKMVSIIRILGHHHNHPLRNQVINIASNFDLNLRQAVFLFRKIKELETSYQFHNLLDKIPAPKPTAAILQLLIKSIENLSTHTSEPTPKMHKAMRYIERAARAWAEIQTPETLSACGFEKIKVDDEYFNFGEHTVIHNWFAFAPYMLKFLNDAIEELTDESAVQNPFEGDPSAIVTLIGSDLPSLYEAIFKDKFSDSYDPISQTTRESEKVKFVNNVLDALGLDTVAPDTIKSYRRRFKMAVSDGASDSQKKS